MAAKQPVTAAVAPTDPDIDKVYKVLNDYFAQMGIRNGAEAATHAQNPYATLNALAMMMGQQTGALNGGGDGPPGELDGPTSLLSWQTPVVPPSVRQRSGRLLLGRGVDNKGGGGRFQPPVQRNYSDSNLVRSQGPPRWTSSNHSMANGGGGDGARWSGGRGGGNGNGNWPGGYSESLARFSVGGTPPQRQRTQPPHPFPSPPDYAEMDDYGLDDILNNRAMLAAANAVGGTYPPRSNIRRSKMIYYLKFGEQGQEPGKFSEPSGVAVTNAGELVVADTNNHRIQVFHPDGRFKFAFGECGKRDGQLLYPNRVAVNRATGDIVITERSPTHQIQVYNQYGQFLSKFGATILQHPRGVTVDSKGRIVVVECKVMRVLIFEMGGALVGRFDCSSHLEFPNGVCVNDEEEIFVSDNRAHAVKVFDYSGHLLRTIGGEGITNFPIGVGINHLGHVVIADNHNNFNVTCFEQSGALLYGQESKVKHAQCFDVALLDDGSVALASKDYRLYLYRYAQVPPSPSESPSPPADAAEESDKAAEL